MKVHEVCSCGGSFDAEGRGALAALADWRASHYHVAAIPFVPSYPIYPANPYPWSPTITWMSGGTSYIAPQTMCMAGGVE